MAQMAQAANAWLGKPFALRGPWSTGRSRAVSLPAQEARQPAVRRRTTPERNYDDSGFLEILQAPSLVCLPDRLQELGKSAQFSLATRSSACRKSRRARTSVASKQSLSLRSLHTVPACSCGFAGPAPTRRRDILTTVLMLAREDCMPLACVAGIDWCIWT